MTHENGHPNAKEKSPAYQWYPKDILSDSRVAAMTNEVEGIYRRLLDHAWLEDGLPADLDLIAPLCKVNSRKRFRQLWMQLDPLFPVWPDGRRRNKRQEKERTKQKDHSEVRREAAGARWRKVHEKRLQDLCNALACANRCFAFALALACKNQDQDQEDQPAYRRATPARMSLSVWNARRHLYRAAHLAIGPIARPDDIRPSDVAEGVKDAAAKLGVEWANPREVTGIVDAAIAQRIRQLQTDHGRARLDRIDRQAMAGRYR